MIRDVHVERTVWEGQHFQGDRGARMKSGPGGGGGGGDDPDTPKTARIFEASMSVCLQVRARVEHEGTDEAMPWALLPRAFLP